MTPLAQILLTGAGALALAASWRDGKKAAWYALIGAGALIPVAVWNVDPTLGLGLLAFLAARFLRPRSVSPENSPTAAASPSRAATTRPGQAP